MKNLLLIFALLATTFSFAHNDYVKVNTEESTVEWTGKKITGSHNGTIDLKQGDLVFNHGTFVGGSFVIDMTSIECDDLTGDKADKLVNHLKSDDFFSVKEHEEAILKTTSVKKASENGYYIVNADITIKGITKPISFDAQIDGNTATAVIEIDRSEFDVKYGSGSFFDNLGDKAIDDIFTLDISLVY